MSFSSETHTMKKLNKLLGEYFMKGEHSFEQERTIERIKLTIEGIARYHLGIVGEVKVFGSFSNGFKTAGSDVDIMFSHGETSESPVSLLGKFAQYMEKAGFENITHIFSANIPLLKIMDRKSKMEVDFCINNVLGERNSLLLYCYCECDKRALQVGKLVKDWAKQHELCSVADGYLNSYAYMLLVIFFLQSLPSPVLPNLQLLASEPVLVADRKWGGEDFWDTKFVDDVTSLPSSASTAGIAELLLGFFHFYARTFDWKANAVCIRLNQPGIEIDKQSLSTYSTEDQWYVEDPFDLKHNLAGKCSQAGRNRIIDEMKRALQMLGSNGSWVRALPEPPVVFFLKCRISRNVTPQSLLEEFEEFDLAKLHILKPEGTARFGMAFLEFDSALNRRRAHTKNEIYIDDCQLQLHYTAKAYFTEIVNTNSSISTFDMASYRMKKKVLLARQSQSKQSSLDTASELAQPPKQPQDDGPVGHVVRPPLAQEPAPQNYYEHATQLQHSQSHVYDSRFVHHPHNAGWHGTHSGDRVHSQLQTTQTPTRVEPRYGQLGFPMGNATHDSRGTQNQNKQLKAVAKNKETAGKAPQATNAKVLDEMKGSQTSKRNEVKTPTPRLPTGTPNSSDATMNDSSGNKGLKKGMKASAQGQSLQQPSPDAARDEIMETETKQNIKANKQVMADSGGWVRLHLHNTLPSGKSLFTDEQRNQIEHLKTVFKNPLPLPSKYSDHVIMNLDLQNKLDASQPVLSQSEVQNMERIVDWLESLQR